MSKPALRLLVAMSYHGGRGRKCYTSQMTLARECGWARGKYPDTRRLRRYLAELQGFDLIYPAGRHVWTDGHWSNAYWVAPYRDRDTESQTDDSDTEGTDSDKESQTASDAIVTSGATDRDNPDQPIVTGSHDKENPATDPSKRPSKKRASRDYRADAWDSLGEVGT